MKALAVPGCPGTTIRELLKAHGLQFLAVEIEPGGKVPLHAHDCAATMVITHGSARKLTGNGPGEWVKAGDVVAKGPKELHGFEAGDEGLKFVSLSDGEGILHEDATLDLAFA